MPLRWTAPIRPSWTRDRGALADGRDRHPARLARAARERAVPRGHACRRSRAGSASSSSTRRIASPIGATTSVPTTGGSSASSSALPANVPAAGDDGDRQRPRRRPTSKSSSVPDLDGDPRTARCARACTCRSIQLDDQAERLAWLAEYLPQLPRARGSSTRSPMRRRRTRQRAGCADAGIDAPAYYGRLATEERPAARGGACCANEVKALVATFALGMGFDKPDLGIRRALPAARLGYLLLPTDRPRRPRDRPGRGHTPHRHRGRRDRRLLHRGAFPPEEVLTDVLNVLEERDGARMLGARCPRQCHGRAIEQALKILEVEGAVAHDSSGWARTANPCGASTRARSSGSRPPAEPSSTDGASCVTSGDCLMPFLTRELDDPRRCSRAAAAPILPAPFLSTGSTPTSCSRRSTSSNAPTARSSRASSGRRGLARAQWPTFPEHLRLQEGRALAIYGDAGWGRLVKEASRRASGFAEELVEAVGEMISTDLACRIPSRPGSRRCLRCRHPELVPGFARAPRRAPRLAVPFGLGEGARDATAEEMENSVQQARKRDRRLRGADPTELFGGPVLLVDDMVDSRWSLTVCGVAP